MAIKLNFDCDNQLILPQFILAHRNGSKINLINNIDEESVRILDALNQPMEINFTVFKTDINGQDCIVWDQLQDFKLVYCSDWNEYFDVSVSIDEKDGCLTKNVSLKHLPESELSRINVYNLEINSEAYIEVDDENENQITKIYDAENHNVSLLHRLFENAPHYEIEGCDIALQNLVRVFSWDSKDIKSCLDELCEEIQAIVEYKAYINSSGEMVRSIYLKDLLSSCNNLQCDYYIENNNQRYRGEFLDECPKCGSHDITNGFGEDTTIFVTSDALGDDLHYENNTDSTKNCFRLIAGDELMTETIANCNPNGGKYLWYWSDKFIEDMSDELRSKLIDTENTNSYQYLYNHYMNDYAIQFTSDSSKYRQHTNNCYYLPQIFHSAYNDIVNKYNAFRGQDEQFLLLPNNYQINKYSNISKYLYDMIDLGWFIKTSMYPNWNNSGDTSAIEQSSILTTELQNTQIAVAENTTINQTIANSAVLNLSKLIVDNRYKITIKSSSFNSNTNKWQGIFSIENYSDNEDNTDTTTITVTINKDFQTYINQTLKKKLDDFANQNDKYDIVGLFSKSLSVFKVELTYYSLDALRRFYDCCQGLINILLEQGTSSISSQDFNNLYQSYINKSNAISYEISVRENDLFSVLGKYYDYKFENSNSPLMDTDIKYELEQLINNNAIQYGMYRYFNDELGYIKNQLNINSILGDTLYKELCSYKCENVYKNDNYSSEGIENNADLFRLAEQFLEKANEDIYKSGNSQHKITTKLRNLLILPEFQVLSQSFQKGNWLRVEIDNKIYRLRLTNYELQTNNIEELDVEFAEITETKNGYSDIKQILNKASSMATSYNFVKQQAKSGYESKLQINDWFQNGLEVTHTRLINDAQNQDQIWDDKGMLFRKFVPELNDYDNEQFKIINNTIALTTDKWRSTKVAIGKFIYTDPADNINKYGYGINAETIVGKLLIGNELGIYNSSGSLKFDNNGFTVSNGINKVSINPSAANNSVFTISRIVNNTDEDLLYFDTANNRLSIKGNINATSGTIAGFNIIGTTGATKLYSEGIEIFTSPMSYASQSSVVGGIVLKNTSNAYSQYSTVMFNSFNIFHTENDEALGTVKYSNSIHSRGLGLTKTIIDTDEVTSSNIFPEGSASFSQGINRTTVIAGGHIDTVSIDLRDNTDSNYDYYLQTSPTEINLFQIYWDSKSPYTNPQTTNKLKIECDNQTNLITSYIPIEIRSKLEVWRTANAHITCIASGYSDASTSSAYTANITVMNEHQEGKLHISAVGNFGVWSTTHQKWLIRCNTAGAITCADGSDRRIKDNITLLSNDEMYAVLKNTPIVNHTYKNDSRQIIYNGIIAQDLRDVLINNNIGYRPYLIIESNDDTDIQYDNLLQDENSVAYSIDYRRFVPTLWKGWQYHDEIIIQLQQEIEKLKQYIQENTKNER